MDLSDITSIIAVAIAAFALWEAKKSNNSQNQLTSREIELIRIQISKEQKEAKHSRTASVSARLMKLNSKKWQVRVFNKGPAEARNVRLILDEQNHIISSEWADQKFPMQKLEVGQSVDLVAIVHMQTPSKEQLRIQWDDATSSNRENVVELTL